MAAGGSFFPTTRWTRIIDAQRTPELRRQLLGELLRAYWKPLYVLARRSGLAREAAEDAVQGLWLRLLEHDALADLDRERGSLRSYLRAALRHHVASGVASARAQKRGGGQAHEALDFDAAEGLLAQAPTTPDTAYERAWAAALVQAAMARLRSEFDAGQRKGSFELLQEVFGFGEELPYREVAARHGVSVTQLKAFAHRARTRFRAIVREAVADTVATEAQVGSETTHLWEILGP